MPDHFIERLFSLFTSSDRAEAMAGDLIEERPQRGSIWFWLHAVRITLALMGRAAADAPLQALALTIAPLFAATAAVNLFPGLMDPTGWMTASLVWWCALLSSGALLTAIARRRGMAATVTLALAGGAVLFTCLFVFPRYAFPQQIEWKDPSPHSSTLVTVDTGVQLEVLDWGGSGPAIVLLAGLGGTAHHYDDFAPSLIDRYRVVGVTRRGHRGSSAAPGGYGFARLAEDVLRVMDAVGVSNPVVIGTRSRGKRCTSWVFAMPRGSGAWSMSMRRSIVETTLTATPSMRWRERCPPPLLPSQVTWRPSRLCVRIWRSTAAPGRRRGCGPGTAPILTGASVDSGPPTRQSARR